MPRGPHPCRFRAGLHLHSMHLAYRCSWDTLVRRMRGQFCASSACLLGISPQVRWKVPQNQAVASPSFPLPLLSPLPSFPFWIHDTFLKLLFKLKTQKLSSILPFSFSLHAMNKCIWLCLQNTITNVFPPCPRCHPCPSPHLLSPVPTRTTSCHVSCFFYTQQVENILNTQLRLHHTPI